MRDCTIRKTMTPTYQWTCNHPNMVETSKTTPPRRTRRINIVAVHPEPDLVVHPEGLNGSTKALWQCLQEGK
jgi:hypothetical protein